VSVQLRRSVRAFMSTIGADVSLNVVSGLLCCSTDLRRWISVAGYDLYARERYACYQRHVRV